MSISLKQPVRPAVIQLAKQTPGSGSITDVQVDSTSIVEDDIANLELGDGLEFTENKLVATGTGKLTAKQLWSDGTEIKESEESETALTFAEILEMLQDDTLFVTVWNGNWILYPNYTNTKGTENAIWFSGTTLLDEQAYYYRIIINSSDEVRSDEYALQKLLEDYVSDTKINDTSIVNEGVASFGVGTGLAFDDDEIILNDTYVNSLIDAKLTAIEDAEY